MTFKAVAILCGRKNIAQRSVDAMGDQQAALSAVSVTELIAESAWRSRKDRRAQHFHSEPRMQLVHGLHVSPGWIHRQFAKFIEELLEPTRLTHKDQASLDAGTRVGPAVRYVSRQEDACSGGETAAASSQRDKIEHLARYVSMPPVATDRLSLTEGGYEQAYARWETLEQLRPPASG